MKCLILILIFALANRVYADNLCFSDKAVRDVQAVSNSIDKCFFSDINNCGLSRKTIEEQKEINATRLIPYDRTSGDGFYDSATGVVSASFIGGKLSGNVHVTTGNKISRCHVLTSAHLLFKEGRFPINSKDSDVNINFHSGQACEHGKIFKKTTSGRVVFKMMDEGEDYSCSRADRCFKRNIVAYSDIIIIKLNEYYPTDRNYFTLNTSKPSLYEVGQRVNCMGYPGRNKEISLPAEKSEKFLWFQKDAKIYGDVKGTSEMGVATNAIAYKGMSGGGCVFSDSPRVLVGVLTNNNDLNGHSAIQIDKNMPIEQGANYLSTFHKLEARYNLMHMKEGKTLANIDKECD